MALPEARHIVYFVGAGLTKSLEVSSHRVPLMNDFISVMADYVYDDAILTALSALELADVFDWTSEQWRELARELRYSEHRTPEKRDQFARILRARPFENIETLLQRSLRKRNLYAESSQIRFAFAINKVFCHIGWNINQRCLERFLASKFSLSGATHTFISFNYDLVLDRCVQLQSNQRWSAQADYGFKIEHYVDDQGASLHMGQFNAGGGAFSWLDARSFNSSPQSDASIKILKPHGSLNWLVEYEGNYNFIDRLPILCLSAERMVTYYPHFDCDYVQLPQSSSPAQTGLFIIPPTESKTRKLRFVRSIRDQEKDALKTADEVYVIGWSMPETDSDQTCLIKTSVAHRDQPIERVTVINYGAPPDYFARIGNIFGVDQSRLRVHNAGFNSYQD